MCNRRRFSFINEITKGGLTSGDKYGGEVFGDLHSEVTV
jgi:hypothetical protein